MACITVCGPLMNSLFALLFYILYTIYTSEYILVFSLLNGWMALANFVPYKINNKKSDGYVFFNILFNQLFKSRSEERRVGKGGRVRGARGHTMKRAAQRV